MKPKIIRTERLILRPWEESDFELFAEINNDQRVMEYLPSTKNREESDQTAQSFAEGILKRGWGFWAVSLIETGDFIGTIGLDDRYSLFPSMIEVGWRLNFSYWGKGYATEGAKAALAYGFGNLNLEEIVAFTAIQNERSKAVMKRVGLKHNPEEDFNHPNLPGDHPLSKQMVCRIKQNEWQKF